MVNKPHKRNSLSSKSIVRIGQRRRKKRKKLSKWQFLTKKATELRKHPTLSEIIFERKIQELGYRYKFQWQFLCNGFGGICDFYIRNFGLCIEIDGGYHLDQDQQQTDRIKDFIYHKLHKKILRITNNQALYLSIDQIRILIDNTVKQGKKDLKIPYEDWKHLQSITAKDRTILT